MSPEGEKKFKIGEILVSEGMLTSAQLGEAIAAQSRQEKKIPLGEVCCNLGFISKTDLRNVLRKRQKHIFLGELFVNLGLLTEDQMSEALAVQKAEKKKLGSVLIEKGYINEKHLVDVLSIQLGIPKIIPDIKLIDKKLLAAINPAFLMRHRFLPVFREGDELTVIMADPLNDETIKDLELFFKCKIIPAIAQPADIKRTIELYFSRPEFGPDAPSAPLRDAELKDLIIGDVDLSHAGGDSIIEVLNYIISNAVTENASDIHIEPLEKTLRVRYRIDGMLYHKTDLPVSMGATLTSRVKILCRLDIAEKRRHQDGRIEARIMGKEVDLRVSTYASIWGENVVVRILHRKSTLVDIEMLGFSPANLARYMKILEKNSGIMLVTGPTGSGKTTTLYASLNYLNKMDKMIITVEDPVEYIIEGVVQGQIDAKIDMNYMDFLKSMMRQDPDVLMIGEIRDQAAAEAAIQAALTGHQVFSTFHTDDTTGALLRLMDMGIDTFLISSTVVSVVSQRLVRILCHACKSSYVPDKEILSSFHIKSVDSLDIEHYGFFRARGCQECSNTGYKGRTGIHELLIVNDAIRDAILARRQSGQIRQVARQSSNFMSMLEDGFYKAAKGITSLDEVLRLVFYSESDQIEPRSANDIIALCEGRAVLVNTPAASAPGSVYDELPEAPVMDDDEGAPAKCVIGDGERYRVKFDAASIACETESIERLYEAYGRLLVETGRAHLPEKLREFTEFVISNAWRLKSRGAEQVDIILRVNDGRVGIFAETSLAARGGRDASASSTLTEDGGVQ